MDNDIPGKSKHMLYGYFPSHVNNVALDGGCGQVYLCIPLVCSSQMTKLERWGQSIT
jgi:hypothetical protein